MDTLTRYNPARTEDAMGKAEAIEVKLRQEMIYVSPENKEMRRAKANLAIRQLLKLAQEDPREKRYAEMAAKRIRDTYGPTCK